MKKSDLGVAVSYRNGIHERGNQALQVVMNTIYDDCSNVKGCMVSKEESIDSTSLLGKAKEILTIDASHMEEVALPFDQVDVQSKNKINETAQRSRLGVERW